MPIKKYNAKSIINSRFLKIMSVKKEQLKNSIVIICADKSERFDKEQIMQMIKQIDKIEPDGVYIPILDKVKIEMYDRSEFKGKKLLINLTSETELDSDRIEKTIKQCIPEAKDISFVYNLESITVIP